MRLNRREWLLSMSALTGLPRPTFAQSTGLTFAAVAHNRLPYIVVPEGYQVSLVVAWGAPMTASAPSFDYNRQSAASQSVQFGYNCDHIGYFPLPDYNSRNSSSGLLAVNHESSSGAAMFPGYVAANTTKEIVDTELASVGLSVVEVRRMPNGAWEYVNDSRFNRAVRGETPIEITGPAAGDEAMRTGADPAGRTVRGTWGNCAGGKTPWGTVLSGEEGFGGYFGNRNAMPDGPLKDAHTRYNVTAGVSGRRWENFYSRFNMAMEPNEPNRFGWVVEVDPYDPASPPKKRTALGRCNHEGATCSLTKDGRVTVYTGDDVRFEFVYKFVSNGRFNPTNRAANRDLLDDGILYVARFDEGGRGEWLPLVFGVGPLTPANGFRNQADVLIRAKFAGTALGATPMDRPEDIETNPLTGKVYVVCTNNDQRTESGVNAPNAANPRPVNRWGHVIELVEDGDDAGATRFRWSHFLICGNPANADHRPTFYGGFDQAKVSAMASPDNIAFDDRGNAWFTTDGMTGQIDSNEAIFAVPTEGPERGYSKLFSTMPTGSEGTGPEFTPDNETLFLAVQHPSAPWPYNETPGRPSVLAFTRILGEANRKIGA